MRNMKLKNDAQFSAADIAEATNGLGATVLKPRKAKAQACRVKSSKGFVKGSAGFATGYPRKVFV
jgi:hypothetical protein